MIDSDTPHSPAPAAFDPQHGSSAMLGYLEGLLSHTGAIMWVRSVPDGRTLLANAAFGELLGRSTDQIVGRTCHELFPADIADSHLANDRAVIEDATPRTSQESAPDRHGRLHQYISHKFALTDPSGHTFAVGGMALDITAIETDRRNSHEARRDSEARFRAVFDHAPIGQIFSSVDGTVTSVNEPMAAMLGYTPEQMVGRPVREFAPPDEFERIKETTAALMANEVLSASDLRRFLHRDGHRVPVRVTSALLRGDDGSPRWWVSMVLDITDEERARVELEQAHEAALLSAKRLRFLHSIATAANEASTVLQLAPHVLRTVCEHLEWDGGALLVWPAGRPICTVLLAHGEQLAQLADNRMPRPTQQVQVVPGTGVLVALPTEGPDTLAWLFRAHRFDLDDDQIEMLSVIGLETARVVERENAARKLRDSEKRFRAVFDASPLPMGLTFGDSGTYAAVNGALCKLVGRSAAELIGKSASDLCHPDDLHLTDPAGAAAAGSPDGRCTFELRLLHSSGRTVIAMVTLAWMDGPDGTRQLLAQMEDITARRTVEEVLRRQAEEDGLTGLANRTHLGHLLVELGKREAHCAVLFVDLDGFKLINDTRGHDVGDEVLVEVAARLRSAVRPGDVVSRFGGDEFVVLCFAQDESRMAGIVADRIETALAEPITTMSGPASVTASIGIASGVVEADAPQRLVQHADAAMYQAKRLGKDRHEIYDDRLHRRAIEHQRTEGSLRTALADGRFTLHYQPIVSLRDSAIVGFEALVRLVDEEGTIVAPDKFIGVAEQSGLIVPMGTWVLQEGCRTIARMRALTGRPLTISVNIAARQAARPDLGETVLNALCAAGLPEQALTLELTESALLEADESTLQQLTMLRNRGVVIGLDDFGTGYSSLTYLRRFPVSHLKVDRSFVSGMVTSSSDHAIVRAVTRLAEDLGMHWIAEGIETLAQRDELAGMGRGFGQGYLFSRPVPDAALPDLLGVPEGALRSA